MVHCREKKLFINYIQSYIIIKYDLKNVYYMIALIYLMKFEKNGHVRNLSSKNSMP